MEDDIVRASQEETGTQDMDLEDQELLRCPSIKSRFHSIKVHHFTVISLFIVTRSVIWSVMVKDLVVIVVNVIITCILVVPIFYLK